MHCFICFGEKEPDINDPDEFLRIYRCPHLGASKIDIELKRLHEDQNSPNPVMSRKTAKFIQENLERIRREYHDDKDAWKN